MKRFLTILLALAVGCAAKAQNTGLWVDESVALGYNRSFGLYDEDATMLGLDLSENYRFRGGLDLHSEMVGAELGARWNYLVSGAHSLGLEGFGIGRWSSSYNFHEYTLGLVATWNWGSRIEARAGTFFRFLKPAMGFDAVTEPFNLAYSLSVWALPMDRTFNFGARLSNLDDFTAERFYCPLLTVRLSYRMSEQYLFYLDWREHSSGTFDLTSNFFDHRIRFGTIIKW